MLQIKTAGSCKAHSLSMPNIHLPNLLHWSLVPQSSAQEEPMYLHSLESLNSAASPGYCITLLVDTSFTVILTFYFNDLFSYWNNQSLLLRKQKIHSKKIRQIILSRDYFQCWMELIHQLLECWNLEGGYCSGVGADISKSCFVLAPLPQIPQSEELIMQLTRFKSLRREPGQRKVNSGSGMANRQMSTLVFLQVETSWNRPISHVSLELQHLAWNVVQCIFV